MFEATIRTINSLDEIGFEFEEILSSDYLSRWEHLDGEVN